MISLYIKLVDYEKSMLGTYNAVQINSDWGILNLSLPIMVLSANLRVTNFR